MSDAKEKFELGRQALERGLAARGQGSMDLAMTCFEEALGCFDAASQIRAAVVTLNNMAVVEQTRGAIDRASELYRDALQRADDADDAQSTALSCGNLAAMHLERGDLTRAEIFANRALSLYTQLDDPGGRGNQLANLGLMAKQKGDYEAATKMFTEAIGAFLLGNNAIGAGRILHTFGELAWMQGDHERARDAWTRAGDLLARAGDRAGLASVTRGLGQLALREGDLKGAKQLFAQGFELHTAMNDARGQAAALLDLGNIAVQEGRLSDALDMWTQSSDKARDSGSRAAMAGAELAQVDVLMSLGRLDDARKAHANARVMFEAVEDERGSANTHISSAQLLLIAGRIGDAEAELDRAEAIASSTGLTPLLAVVSGTRSHIADMQDQPKKASELLEKTREFYLSINAVAGVHYAALGSAERDFACEEAPELNALLSEPRLVAAQTFFKESNDTRGLLQIKRCKATIHRYCGDYAQAATLFEAYLSDVMASERWSDQMEAQRLLLEVTMRRDGVLDVAPLAALAEQLESRGFPLRALRCSLMAVEAMIAQNALEQAVTVLGPLSETIDTLPDPYPAARTLWMDVKSRLLVVQGDVEGEGTAMATLAMERYRASEDAVGARELQAWLTARSETPAASETAVPDEPAPNEAAASSETAAPSETLAPNKTEESSETPAS